MTERSFLNVLLCVREEPQREGDRDRSFMVEKQDGFYMLRRDKKVIRL